MSKPSAISRITCLNLVLCLFQPASGQDSSQTSSEPLRNALREYDAGEYEHAQALLQQIDFEASAEADQLLIREYSDLCSHAVSQQRRADAHLDAAQEALDKSDWDVARAHLQAILANKFAGPALKITARARLQLIHLRHKQATQTSQTSPVGVTAGTDAVVLNSPQNAQWVEQTVIDPFSMAEELVDEGMAAIGDRNYFAAQRYFSLAQSYVPAAPVEQIYVDTRYGVLVDMPPLAGSIPVQIPVQRPSVSMNLDMGTGRLVGSNSFQFSASPAVGVGSSGFVQLPSIKRTRIKTSRTMPVADMYSGPHHIIFLSDYLVLVRPKLFPK